MEITHKDNTNTTFSGKLLIVEDSRVSKQFQVLRNEKNTAL
jgi:hypothetical protein